MKKIVFILVLCAVGYFTAPHLVRSADSEYTNQTVYEHDDTKIYRSLRGRHGRELAVGSYAVMLDLDALESVTEPTKLFTVYGNAVELGLMATPEGITGNWKGQVWKNDGVVSSHALSEQAATLRIGKRDCLPLLIVSNGGKDVVEGPNGFSMMDKDGELLLNFSRLCTALNESFKRVEFNPDLVKYVEIFPRVMSNKRRVSRALSKFSSGVKAADSMERKALVGAGVGGLLALIIMIASRKSNPKRNA